MHQSVQEDQLAQLNYKNSSFVHAFWALGASPCVFCALQTSAEGSCVSHKCKAPVFTSLHVIVCEKWATIHLCVDATSWKRLAVCQFIVIHSFHLHMIN